MITSPANNAVLTTSTHAIQWQDTGATSYEVRVLRGAEVELYFRVSAPGTSTIYSFRSGTYTASVRACLAVCGDWPAPITFTVNLPPVWTTPPVISSATVNWNAISGADLYLVQVVQPAPAGPGGGALTVASTRTSSTSAVLAVPAGAAFVFAAACNGDGCQGNSAPFPINPAGPNPASPSAGSPAAGSPLNGPVVLISWSRIPGDNGSNTTYRLYVEDMGRQKPALDVLTKSNFYGAYFSPGTRYDIVVIANPGTASQVQGPASGFSVRGAAPQHSTLTTPTHDHGRKQRVHWLDTAAGFVDLSILRKPGGRSGERFRRDHGGSARGSPSDSRTLQRNRASLFLRFHLLGRLRCRLASVVEFAGRLGNCGFYDSMTPLLSPTVLP